MHFSFINTEAQRTRRGSEGGAINPDFSVLLRVLCASAVKSARKCMTRSKGVFEKWGRMGRDASPQASVRDGVFRRAEELPRWRTAWKAVPTGRLRGTRLFKHALILLSGLGKPVKGRLQFFKGSGEGG